MAEKKSWRDYTKDNSTEESTKETTTSKKTGSWRDYTNLTGSGKTSGGWRDYRTVDPTSIVGENVVNQVNSWLQNHNSYITEYQKRYEGRKYSYEDAYVGDSADWLNTAKQKKSTYDAEADAIISYLYQNRDYLDASWMQQIKSTITKARDTQNQLIISAQKDNDYWAKFTPNEDQAAAGYTAEKLYNEWQAGQKQYAADQTYDVDAGMLELEELKKEREAYLVEQEEKRKQAQENESWMDKIGRWLGTTPDTSLPLGGASAGSSSQSSTKYDSQISALEEQIERAKYVQGYEGFMDNMDAEDYAANSQYASTRTDVAMEDAMWGFGKTQYDTSKLFGDFMYDYINRNEDALSAGMVNDTATDAYFLGFDKGFLKTMTDDEIGVYNYLYKTQGQESANAFLSHIESNLEGRRRAQEQAFWASYAKSDPVGSSVFSTLISPLKGLSYVGQAADMLDDGKMEENAGYNRFSYIPTTIRSQVSTTIEKSGKWGKVGSFAYNTGMSMADFLFTTAVSGGNQALSLSIMGSGAAADATLAAKDRGLDDAQAFTLGTIAGLAEVAMEKISLGAWLEGDMTEGALRYMLKNALSEGGEEAGTSVINLLADVIIAGDKSEWNMAMQAYIDQGKSEAEAFGLVLAENAAQIGLDALGGALSGSAIGGGTYAGASIGAGFQYGDIGKDKAQAQQLVTEGLELNPTSQYVQKAQSKLDKGKNLTGMQVRNILAANKEQVTANDMKKIQKAAEKRFADLGQTKDVSELAEIATKWATGQEITRAEKRLLTHSEYGSRVANELLPENIASEDYSTEWAEEIGTKQVNAGAYNKKAIRNLLEAMASTEDPNAYKSLESRMEAETPVKVSDTGKTVVRVTGEEIDLKSIKIKDITEDSVVVDVNGKDVDISDVDFATEDQWNMFNALKKIEHITPGVASAMVAKVDMAKPIWGQMNGMDEAYTYGFYGYSEADLKAGLFTGSLTKEQLNDAYKLGQYAREKSATAKADAYKQMRTAAQAQAEKEAKAEGKKTASKAKNLTITYNKGNGEVVSFDEAGITDAKQSGAVEVAKILHQLGLGTRVEFFSSHLSETLTDKKGNPARVFLNDHGVEQRAYSGVYRKSDGTIRVDLNAYNGRGLTLNALSHELTHFIQQWSDQKYQVLIDFLMKEYENTDMTMHERVLREQKRLENIRGEEVSYDEAYDEVVANAMSKMFDDGKLVEKLTQLKEQDMTLAQKLWEGFKKILAKFMGIYEKEGALFQDAADLMEMKETFEQLQNMFAEALVEASENYQASLTVSESQTLTEAGIGFDEDTKSVYSLHFSTAFKDEIQVGKKTFNTEAIAQVVAKGTGRSIEDARKWVQSELTIANIVMANPEFLDFEADDRYDAIKKNSDYPQGTVDLSNLCPKREEFTTMFDMLQKKYPNKLFTAQDVAEMRKILSDNDITVACGACFVEDRRQLLGEIADTYINMWKEAVETGKPLQKTNAAGVKSDLLVTKALAKQYGLTAGTKIMATDTYIPNQYDLTTYEGFKLLEKNHPTIAMGFNRYNNSRGQQSARLIEGRAEYKRQILGWSDAKVRSVNNNGGLRIFSFSDFEVVHLLDLAQVIIDCAAKGVKIQGYTKIPAFAKLVRDTGIKLNRSLIPKGDYGYHMENGKVVLDYDTTEGINIKDKNFIDESNNPNVGNIVIGINPTQIGAAMLDPFIDYIIPFHSNKAKEILKKLGTGEWVNYKESQHEKDISTGTSSKHNVNIYTEVINKYHPTNKVEFVEAFLKECKRQGKIPRYAEFLNVDENGDYAYREGYHKLLVDFKMFDAEGNILPQGNITPKLDEGFMTELLNAEIDKKQNYEFPQKVYEDIDKKFGEQYSEHDSGERFSLHDTVEETKDLVAFHNISEKLLWDALKQKGLVMPSLAVTNKGLDAFGEISLLFDKSVIDPAVNKDNKLYGADAWTPMQTTLKMNAKFDTNKTVNAVNTMKDHIGSKYVSELLNITPKQFKEAIIKADGNIYEAYAHNIGVQTAYAMEKGIISQVPTNKDGTVNHEMLQKQLDKTLDTDEGWRQYRRWLTNISDTVITSYDQATNEDVLRHMKSQPATAKSFKLSETGELVVPAVEYSSIKELRRNKNRLSENAEEATKAVASEFLAFAQKIGDTQQVVEAINAGFEGRYNIADIMKAFSNKGIKLSSKEAGELQSLYKKAVELPTQYFEAKPGGEVGLDKVNTAVVPDNVSAEIRQALEEQGINVIEYKQGSKESRTKVVNSVEGLKFSSQETDLDENGDADYDGIGLNDIKDVVRKGTGIKWNNGNTIKLESKEYAAVTSRISTQYKRRENHGGVQCIERSTDGEDAKFFLYLFVDHGFDNYEIIARLDYAKQYELIHELRRMIQNGRKTERVSTGSGGLRSFHGNSDRSGNSNPNGSIKNADDEKNSRSRGQRSKDNGLSGAADSNRSHERSNSTGKLGQEMHSDHETDEVTVYHGSKNNFEEFDFSRLKDELGVFFSENEGGASRYGNVNTYTLSPKKTLVVHQGEEYRRIMLTGETDAEKRARFLKEGYDTIKLVYRKPGGGETVEWVALTTEVIKKQGQDGVQYSEHDTDYSNRSLLANAFEGITQNSVEYKMIQEYKGHIKDLNALEKELSKLNAEIRQLRFGKDVARDPKRLQELETKAKAVAQEINRHDKKLLSLEASEPLRKVIERERKKEAQKTKAHVQEIQQNKKVRAEQTELRHKIRKTVRDLDKILNRGNKKLNVKEDMKGFASKALELADYLFSDHISNDDLIRKGITVRMTPKEAALVKETEDILSKLYDHADSLTNEEFTQLDAQRKKNLDKLRDLLTAQRNERLNTPVYNLFNDLVTEYAGLKNSKQDAVKDSYDPNVERFLRSYIGETNGETDSDRKTLLQNMRVADMTTDELWKLHNAYKMVLHAVRNANKLWVSGKTESIEQMAGRIMGDFANRKIPDKKVAIVARNIANKIGWDYEKLYYALDRIGSEAFTELVMNIANSENIVMQDIMEAVAFRDKMIKKYGFNNWAVNKEIDREFLDNTGKKFKLTLGQLMALYAYSRREGAWDHIEYGGFVFGEAALTNPKPADSYKLSKAQCEAITGLLTKEQKGYAEDMQKFLSETMGEKGNEVSMLLYGIKMFGEKNYFPIHVAGQFKAQANESQAKAAAGFSSMSNAGFTHAQNPNAKAPFVLEGFNEIWADHVNEMSRYHGTVPALEDMRRVMNRSFYSESGMESMAIKQMMENAFGKDAVEYFNNLYKEANSGAITDKLQKKSHKLLSLFRKNSVAYSLSVLIQQPASMVRAYAMINRKYFGLKGFGAITSGVAKAVSDKWTKAHTNAYNEMLKYAPGVTMAKEIGGFDTHTGGSIRSYLLDTNKKFSQKWKTGTVVEKGKAILDKVDNNAIANLPNFADKIAWIEIWNACKREAVAKHKDLAPNSEEFMQAVGERFTEVIRATQVYDSMFAKSPMLKSKNLAVQYLVSFMNEPNTTANMVEKAVRDATRGDWKGGVKTAAVVIHSIIFTNLLKSIIYAMRDDDEDETYIEKYIEAVAGNIMDDFNAFNYIPIARDVVSLAQGYDVERADMAIVADALDAINSVIKNATTDTDDMTEEQLVEFDKKVTEANWKLVESLASFFGIPIKNIRREIDGVIDHARIAHANAGQTTALSAWDKVSDAVIDSIPFMQSKNTKQDKLYDAIVSGDKEYLARLKSTYKTDSAYQSAVRKALRENDPRIQEAAQARYEGKTEEYKRIFREIQNEGKFSFDDIMSAINTELSKLEPDKVASEYSARGFVEAIAMGNTSEANAMRDDIIATHIANGKTQDEAEEAFASAVSTGIHNAYSSGLLDEAGAEKMLTEYAGKDEEEAASKVAYWAFCDEHPGYDFSESNVNDYLEFAEPAGISLDVYEQFIKGTKGLETIKDEWGDVEVTEREQVLEVIDSLPLSWQQKDALYLAYGYAESQIWDVPW